VLVPGILLHPALSRASNSETPLYGIIFRIDPQDVASWLNDRGARGTNHGDDRRKSAIFSSISLQEVWVLFPGTGLKLQNSQKTAILPKIHDWEAAA